MDQWEIATHPAKIKVLCMGRRWGKTMMSGAVCLAAAARGNAVAWVAPSYKNTRPLWRFAERIAGGVADVSRSERVITFPRAGWLGVYSAADDADAIRGEAFDLVVMDEAAKIPEEAWTDAIQPTLADSAGDALLISTPRGRNWFWREWLRGNQHDAGYASFTAPSSANPNPNIKRAAALARERVSDRTYRQEWLAEFVEDGSGVFRNVRAAATAERWDKWREGAQIIGGLDWALSTDFTVLTLIDAATMQVVHTDRFNGVDYSLQRERIKATAERFRATFIIAEANAMGKPNNDELRRMGVRVRDFTTTNTTKADAIESLAAAFERGQLRIPPDQELIAELEAFESERLPSGMTRYAAPAGMHDDHAMSLALAFSAVAGRVNPGAYGWST